MRTVLQSMVASVENIKLILLATLRELLDKTQKTLCIKRAQKELTVYKNWPRFLRILRTCPDKQHERLQGKLGRDWWATTTKTSPKKTISPSSTSENSLQQLSNIDSISDSQIITSCMVTNYLSMLKCKKHKRSSLNEPNWSDKNA